MTCPTEPEEPGQPEARQAPGEPVPASPMAGATADLALLQEVLRRAAQGQADVGEVKESLTRYWGEHGDALRTVAAALGEHVRGQMLDELYRMREQLARQLGNQAGPAPRPRRVPPAGEPDGAG
jgi:hypothetical protein